MSQYVQTIMISKYFLNLHDYIIIIVDNSWILIKEIAVRYSVEATEYVQMYFFAPEGDEVEGSNCLRNDGNDERRGN